MNCGIKKLWLLSFAPEIVQSRFSVRFTPPPAIFTLEYQPRVFFRSFLTAAKRAGLFVSILHTSHNNQQSFTLSQSAMSGFSSDLISKNLQTLSLDDDILEYITSMIEDSDVFEEDTFESVLEFVCSSSDQDEDVSKKSVSDLFDALRSTGDSDSLSPAASETVAATTALLSTKVNMKKEDDDLVKSHAIKTEISEFFSKQIELTDAIPLSMKNKRKEAQRKMRLQELETQRQREIDHEMELAASATAATDSSEADNDDFNDSLMQDVNLHNFNLPNKKGSGEDLLVDANLTLSCRRRYGFIGKNGCGKTTLLEVIASRSLAGINPRMTLLLVKQEIVGMEVSAWVVISCWCAILSSLSAVISSI